MARKWWTLTAVVAGMFMLLLDVTIVNVALPQIQQAFSASLPDLQWIIDAYALTLAALLLTAGALADRFGRRITFAAGTAIFTAQLRNTVTGRLAGTPLAPHAHAIAAGLGGPKSSGVQSGLTAAARQAVAGAARAGFADSLKTILLIGAAIAAIAAITSLTLIRSRDFAAVPAAPGTEAGLPAAEPATT
jgi:MFS family permease